MLNLSSGHGFFLRVKGHLKDEFSGRLMALALRELGTHEPTSFIELLSLASCGADALPRVVLNEIRKGSAQFVCEWCFRAVGGNTRRADLAVLLRGEPILLFEVKEDDVASEGNESQADDYLAFLSQRAKKSQSPTTFLYLSRFAPTQPVSAALRRAAQRGLGVHEVRYRALHKALRDSDRPLARMLVEYLEEIGVDAYRAIDLEQDGTALAMLLLQTLGFDHFHGLGRLHSDAAVAAIPRLMALLLGNVAVFGDWLQEANRHVIGRRPTRKFVPEREFSVAKLTRAVEQMEPDEEGNAVVRGSGKLIQSGSLYFYTQASIRSPKGAKHALPEGEWLYAEIGYRLSVARGDRANLSRMKLYSNFLEPDWKKRTVTAKRTFSRRFPARKSQRRCSESGWPVHYGLPSRHHRRPRKRH